MFGYVIEGVSKPSSQPVDVWTPVERKRQLRFDPPIGEESQRSLVVELFELSEGRSERHFLAMARGSTSQP